MKKILKNLFFILLLPLTINSQDIIKVSNVRTLNGLETGYLSFDSLVTTGWFPGWQSDNYPARILVDLGGDYFLTNVLVYDNTGKPTLTFEYYDGFNFKEFESITLDLFQRWNSREVRTPKTRYIRITLNKAESDNPCPEIFFVGTTKPLAPIQTPPSLRNLSGDARKIGINGFHWIPWKNAKFPCFRVYQMLYWTWTPLGIKVEPSQDGSANYDSFLKDAKEKGIDIVFCPNKSPSWFNSKDNWSDTRLHRPEVDGTKPEHYTEIGQYYWQITARYGRKSWPVDRLWVNQVPKYFGEPINEKLSGLNLLNYLEVENEPDRPWNNPENKYTPEQYAALLCVSYDAIKNADPSMKVVMGGLSSINTGYLQRMLDWCKLNNHVFPADVINVHHYCNYMNSFPGPDINLWMGIGISPEQDRLEERLLILIRWVKDNNLNCQIWFSEFGYDTVEPSTMLGQYPQLYNGLDAETLQSWWLQRTYLIGLSVGLDKMFMYNGIDENSASQGYVFGSSGLSTGQYPQDGQLSFKKKKAYVDLQWLISELNGFTYQREIKIHPDIKILIFKNKRTIKYFYWSTTSNGTKIPFRIKNKNLMAEEFPQTYTQRLDLFENINKIGENVQRKD